jgi:hypothetical protein
VTIVFEREIHTAPTWLATPISYQRRSTIPATTVRTTLKYSITPGTVQSLLKYQSIRNKTTQRPESESRRKNASHLSSSRHNPNKKSSDILETVPKPLLIMSIHPLRGRVLAGVSSLSGESIEELSTYIHIYHHYDPSREPSVNIL